MILNNQQLASLKEFNKLVSQGKSKTEAADLVGVARSTIKRWESAENAPKAGDSKTTAKKATKKAATVKQPKAKKVKEPKKTPVRQPETKAVETTVDTNTNEYKVLSHIIEEQLGVSTSDIKPEAKFIDDMGADSLDAVELVMALEEEFEVEVPDEEAEKVQTVADAYNLILVKTGKTQVAKPVAQTMPAEKDELVPFQFIALPTTFTIVRDGRPVQIDKSHQNFTKISEIVKEAKDGRILKSKLSVLHDLIDLKAGLKRWSNGRVEVTETGGVLVDGKKLHGKLADVLLRCLKDGDMGGLERFAKFHTKVIEALSFKVTTRLFEFITKTGLRIDEDGDIIALKVVRANYLDKHSGTFDNSPGKTVSMPRNSVDDRDEVTCSNGLHVCAPGYIQHFSSRSGGDRLVECKVDPRDFVSVPVDYNFDKARVCKYIVLKDVSQAYKKELYNA